jgi:hypothetical protein
MSKSGFEDEVLIKLIVGVVKHVTIDELGPIIIIIIVIVIIIIITRKLSKRESLYRTP